MEQLGEVALVYMPAHVGSHQSAAADAIAKAALDCKDIEDTTEVYEWVVSRRMVYEVMGTDGKWALHDGPTYRMLKDRVGSAMNGNNTTHRP